MTDHTPLTEQQLDETAARAMLGSWGIYEHGNDGSVTDITAEVRRVRATPPMVCINCETPVGWVDCPTGGWWAHETHPADGHDADPKPAVPAVETGR